ncbi:hypothetical protein BC828DRAFT_389161 [Blastocladiella britannica]|nr:hypothetical protein BC828DRAFT_389161 [Blastocladiella britannica]
MEMDALRKAANRFGKSAALIYRHHGPRGIDDQALGRFEQWQIANKLTGETRVGRMMGQQTRRYRHANAKSRAVVSDDESDDDSDESDDSEDEGSSDGDQAGRSDTTKPAASSAAADRRRRNSSSSTTSTSAGPPFATITLGSGRRSQPAAAAAAAAHEAPGTGRYSSRAYTPLQPEYTPSLKDRPGRWTALENLALRRAAVFCGLNVELILARYGEQGTVNRSLGRFNATQVTARFVNEKRSGRPIHSAESPRVTSPSDPEPELTAADVDTYGLRAALTQVATPMSSPIVGAPQQWQIPPPAPPLSSSLPASPSLRPPAAAPRAAAAATPSMSSLTTSGPFPKSEPSARMGPPSSSSLHASPLITSPSSGDRHRRMSPPTTTIASATLSPNVYGAANHNKLKWTEEVHQLLYKLVLHYGPRWDVIYERHGHELPNVSNTFSIAAVVYRAASRKVAPQPIIDMTIKGRGFWATSTKSNPPPLLYYSMDALNEPYIPSEEPAAAAAPAMDASPGDANRKRKISELSELPPDEGEEEEEEDEAGGSPTKIPRLS